MLHFELFYIFVYPFPGLTGGCVKPMTKLNPICIYPQVNRAACFPWHYSDTGWGGGFRTPVRIGFSADRFSLKGLLKNLISSPE
jgi:hypothetical protein